MLRLFAVELLACLFLTVCAACPVEARIRIYGGPVSAAGSGQYYAPHGGTSTFVMYGADEGAQGNREQRRIDLNPLFIPGHDFIPPGYVPKYFPRASYLAYDYFGYHLESANDD